MEAIIRSSMFEYLACTHAITGVFGHLGESVSKIKNAEYLIM